MSENASAANNLVCPFDLGRLKKVGSQFYCSTCGRRVGEVDKYGIISLSKAQRYSAKISEDYLDSLLTRQSPIDAFFCGTLQDEEEGEIADCIREVGRDIPWFNLPLSPNSRVLSFGAGWEMLPRTICCFVKEVVAMNLTYPSLAISSIVAPSNVIHVHGGDGRFLPFRNETFDLVILGAGVARMPRRIEGGSATDAQLEFLKDVKRILKKGGEVSVSMENRFRNVVFAGHRGHRTSRLSSLELDAVADFRAICKGTRHRQYTYSKGSLMRLMRLAGFPNIRAYWPWWRYQDPPYVFPYGKPICFDPNHLPNTAIRHKMGKILFHLLSKMAKMHFCAPGFYVRASAQPLETSFADSLIGHARVGADTNEGLSMGAGLVAFGRNDVFKVGTDAISDKDIRQDYYSGEFARTFEQLRHFVPDRKMTNRNGHPVLVTAKMEPIVKLTASVTLSIDTFLSALGSLPKKVTTFGEAFEDTPISQFLDLTGARKDWEIILKILRDRPLLLGTVHGDFHLGQIFWFGGQMKVIDWSLFSTQGIYGADHFLFAMDYWLRQKQLPWWETFSRRLLKSDRYLSALIPNQGAIATKLSFQSKIAFAMQAIVRELSGVYHPIGLSNATIRERCERIQAVKRCVESMEKKYLKTVVGLKDRANFLMQPCSCIKKSAR